MPADFPDRPLPNCYWVLPGELLAGEHPARGALEEPQLRERLRNLMDAGIDCFIDLTMPEEFDSYERELPPGVQYVRRPIRDHALPARPEHMVEILAYIDEALRAGRRPYVHCHAGIGRTGIVIGCFLVERGESGEHALESLNVLWRQNERSRSWPFVPETEEQIGYVLQWRAQALPDAAAQLTALPPRPLPQRPARQPQGNSGTRDRFHGALLGLAVGDALAVPTQGLRPGAFTPVAGLEGGGANALPAGAWTDDTSMALCIAESLLECGAFDPRDQVERLERWQREGYLAATGECVGITPGTARALAAARWRRQVFAGSHDPKQLDPEVLPRVAAATLYAFGSVEEAMHLACESSRLTCQAPGALEACRLFAASVHAALAGLPKSAIVDSVLSQGEPSATSAKVSAALGRGAARPPKGGATAAEALVAVYWALMSNRNFQEGALHVANLGGGSADATTAAYGLLAGAHYGVQAIPPAWSGVLMRRDLITDFAERLHARTR
jgi:ADP-ribosyl-[dinitrogen reductase] hydrolase